MGVLPKQYPLSLTDRLLFRMISQCKVSLFYAVQFLQQLIAVVLALLQQIQ